MSDDHEDRPPADALESEQAAETEYVPEEVDPVEAKQRLLTIIDDELNDSPKGRAAKEIVTELPIEE